jgi:hypothetical protein
LAATTELLDEARRALGETVAAIACASVAERWTVSRYYEPEMGPALWRQYVALEGLMPPQDLVGLKLTTNALEARWRVDAQRRVNIDPGYVDLDKLVLASSKNAAHRIYLDRGIYAEVTLRFMDGQFEPLAHTYPDYAAPSVREFFSRVREQYRQERAAARKAGARCGD